MRSKVINKALLFTSTSLLVLGFFNNIAWFLSGVLGLIPALAWVIQDLRNKSMGSDVLALLSIAGTLATHELLASAIVALMLATGRVLENWAEGHAERELKSLLGRMPTRVHRISSNSTTDISIEDVKIGDELLVRTGEVTPTDGILLSSATLDESALTGEPLPVESAEGEEISSGVLNAGPPFTLRATTTAAESTYAGIVRLVRQAQADSAPGVRLANRWAITFVPIAISMSAITYLITGESSRAIAILVAATPCPLILAVPIAIVAGLSRAAKHGAIIKGGSVLEALGKTSTVLLDKTGTLTHGGPAISEINTRIGVSDDEALALAASVDQFSPHVVAAAIVNESRRRNLQLLTATEIEEVAGHHIKGFIDDSEITVGQMSHSAPEWLHFNYPLMVSVERDGELIAVIGLEDPVRPESRAMVNQLRTSGVEHIALVTGDRDETAQLVAAQVGITEVFANVSASGKLDIARKAKEDFQGSVVVVGDGINDAPALALADVGVAMGARGASAASEAADVVIVEDSIDRLTSAIRIAKYSRSKALQAAGIGMGLSLVAMILGALGFLTPSAGAIAQECIDIAAIFWALTTLAYKEAK